MDIKDKVVESQRKIIDALAACELHIGSLYEKYASLFPGMEAQWRGLAAAEKTHADLLKTLHRILDKGRLFFNIGKFDDRTLQPVVSLVETSLKKADTPGFTADEAVATALQIEASILDAHFYDLVSSDAPEFKIIAERLSSDTRKHVAAIRDRFHGETPA